MNENVKWDTTSNKDTPTKEQTRKEIQANNKIENDKDKFNLYTNLLYNQALLIEGLSISDPVEFTNNICKIMK